MRPRRDSIGTTADDNADATADDNEETRMTRLPAIPSRARPVQRAMPRAASVVAALACVLATATAQAQRLSPTPEPGLWETEMTMRVNGQDIMAAMRAQQEQMLQAMPPAQRAQMAAMMQGQGGMVGGRQRHCVTAAEAAQSGDARTLLAQMQADAPECRFEPVQAGGATLRFKGRCEDPDGFTGDVTGEMTIEGAKSLTWRYEGHGKLDGIDRMPGMAGAGRGPVQMTMHGRNRWVAAACGDVKPGRR